MAIKFIVNEEERLLDADESMPLLWALRDLLGLHGAKYGCGVGVCGVWAVPCRRQGEWRHQMGFAMHCCFAREPPQAL